MVGCIVCNEQFECQYEELNMAVARSRLEKVMEEAVPEDSVICSACQFDLEQIEMYYCHLNAFKMRYWQAAEDRRNLLEGYEAPTRRNVLAEMIRYSTVDTPDISEGMKSETVFPVSMYSVKLGGEIIPENLETSAPLGIEILDVRSLQEDWQQVTDPPGEDAVVESLVQEDQAGNGLDLGCWSEGSSDCQNELEDHQQGENLMAIHASASNEYKYNTEYFGYDGSNITDQLLTHDSAAFSGALPVVPTSTGRKPGRPRKIKHGRRGEIPLGDLITSVTPQNNEDVDKSASTSATPPFVHTASTGRKARRPRKKKPGRPRNNRGGLIASPRSPGAFQNNDSLHPVRGMATSKRKVGRPRKNPGEIVGPKNPVGRPRKKASVGVVAVPDSAVGVKTSAVADVGARSGFFEGKKLIISIKKLDVQQVKNEPSTGAKVNSSQVKSRKARRRRKKHRTEEPRITESRPSPDTNSRHDPELVEDLPLSERVKKSKRRKLKRRRSHIGMRKCVHCGLKFPSDDKLIMHSLTHNDAKPFKCATCGKGFSTRYYQIMHASLTHASDNREKYVCTVCGKALMTKSYLKLHMERHTGNLQYQCSICDRACVSISAFKQHMLVHSDEKPHKCNQCGKAYKQIYPLRVHMLTHTGERPFKCECGLDFKEKVALKVHMKSLSHAKRLGIQP